MMTAADGKQRKQQSYFSRVKHDLENQSEPLRDLDEFGGWDSCDPRFVAPSLLNKDGSLNAALLFGYKVPKPADRRYILREMEAAREAFLDRILEASRRKKEEERRIAEEAEDAKEMRKLKERFAKVNTRLEKKGVATEAALKQAEEQVVVEEHQRKLDAEKEFWNRERERVAALEKRAEEMPPDFPTTFSVCSRLHASPRRGAAAAAAAVTSAGTVGDVVTLDQNQQQDQEQQSASSTSASKSIVVHVVDDENNNNDVSTAGVGGGGGGGQQTPPPAVGSALALASARRRQQQQHQQIFRDATQSPLASVGFDVRGGKLVPVTEAGAGL